MPFSLTALTIIMIATVLISLKAMNDEELKERWMYIPYRVKNNRESYRIFSHLFIHADVMHLIFNMASLYFLGVQALESQYSFTAVPTIIEEFGLVKGEVHIVAIYILGGLFATMIPYLRNQDNSNYRSLGASGAVSAIVFATIMWDPGMKLQFIFVPIPFKAYWFGIFYLAYEIYMDKRGNTGIAHDAHLGGAILGIIYILVINPEKGSNFIQQLIS